MGNTLSREPDRCGEPGNPVGAGSRDGTQSATAADQYAARHNPFIYFHSILDCPLCNTKREHTLVEAQPTLPPVK